MVKAEADCVLSTVLCLKQPFSTIKDNVIVSEQKKPPEENSGRAAKTVECCLTN